MNKLPDKPSELIRLALSDLRACEADPLYDICMGKWHTPNFVKNVCYVCLAGAVMAKTLQCPSTTLFVPSVIKSGYATHLNLSEMQLADLTKKLMALHWFRGGYIEGALGALGISRPNTIPETMNLHSYHISRSEFYNDMEGLARLLKQHGY